MSDLNDLASRMYPASTEATPTPQATPPAPAAQGQLVSSAMYPQEPEATPEPVATASTSMTVDELVARELSPGEAMYADGSVRPDNPAGYDHSLAGAFDPLEFNARYDQATEDVQALAEGRREAAAMLHELEVPAAEASDIARTLGDWHSRAPLDEDTRWDQQFKTLDALEREWGPQAEARIALAQQTAVEACKRMPWLGDLLKAGAGNDPKLIKLFAEIGLRQARRQRK